MALKFGKSFCDRDRLNDGYVARCDPLEPVGQLFNILQLSNHDRRQKAVLSSHPHGLDNLRAIFKHLVHFFDFARHGVEPHMRRYIEAEGFRIDRNRVALDRAAIFKFVNAFGYAGA